MTDPETTHQKAVRAAGWLNKNHRNTFTFSGLLWGEWSGGTVDSRNSRRTIGCYTDEQLIAEAEKMGWNPSD